MSRTRVVYLGAVALLSGGLLVFVLTEAVIHDAFTRSIVYALLPLLLVFFGALKKLRGQRD